MALGEVGPAESHREIRVLIVDDQHLFADAIRWTLERLGMTVTGVAVTGEQGLAMARQERPDLVLLDLGLPGMGGIEVGKLLIEEIPDLKVLAVTAMADSRKVKEAMAIGFHGYLTKDMPVTEFADSIKLAFAGHVVMPQVVTRELVGGRSLRERQAALLAGELTSRERDVLTLLAEGESTPQVAKRLSITRNTVRTHVQSILNKLQVHSRLEAVAFGLRHGVIEVSGEASRP